MTDDFPYDKFPVGRPFKIFEDYVALGNKVNLTYLGLKMNGKTKQAPRSVRNASYWKCQLCGEVMFKAYRSVYKAWKDGYPGCVCQSKSTEQDIYVMVGERLGWALVGTRPRNNKQLANWIDFYGFPVKASLVDLTNNPQGKIRKKFRSHVNPKILIEGLPKKITDWKK